MQMSLRYSSLHTFHNIPSSVSCLVYSPTGEELAVGCVDGSTKIFSVDLRKELRCFRRAEIPVTTILWHPTKPHTLFVGYQDGKLYIVGVSIRYILHLRSFINGDYFS